MSDDHDLPRSEDVGEAAERRQYIRGAVATLALTLAAFGLVGSGYVSGGTALVVLCTLAIVQIAAHFRFFLHIDLARSHRDDLQLILFTALIVALMVGGTVWILFDQHTRM
ncbi:cytochrome o ubiquinol oxidase subunit IV [Wenxinia marina]|uniref:Cytochrome bo(3) ubiquinol oxidase subunit 4 n=1 Tax=Wenxinia marina DSM 24838 TaxID=1123501 RepID=A0A0D0QH67_9RHOB|nr:cytochrome o ubiquinol oxidase subunit IV [Wenxinia marina]KIQ70403.1 cytochrome bo3 quinol oxidase subunit 4 [Wenxinia marina DSM 24838]GGL53456.1 cytochrome o ubiquinol oxidase subunit IV [Wenxinia marina]